MLDAKRSASVAQEVSLRNLSCAGNEIYKWGIYPGFELVTRIQKQGHRFLYKEDFKNFNYKTRWTFFSNK